MQIQSQLAEWFVKFRKTKNIVAFFVVLYVRKRLALLYNKTIEKP